MRFDTIATGPNFTPIEVSDITALGQVRLTRIGSGDYITDATDVDAANIADLLTKGVIAFDHDEECYMINSTRYTAKDSIGKPIADITWFVNTPETPFFGNREFFESAYFKRLDEPTSDFILYREDPCDKLFKIVPSKVGQ